MSILIHITSTYAYRYDILLHDGNEIYVCNYWYSNAIRMVMRASSIIPLCPEFYFFSALFTASAFLLLLLLLLFHVFLFLIKLEQNIIAEKTDSGGYSQPRNNFQ